MVQSAPPATKNMYRLWSTAPVSHERKYQAPQRKQDVSHICRKPAYPPLPSPPHAGNRKDRGRHPPPEVSLAHPSIPSHPIHTYTNKPSTTTKPIPSPKFQNNKSSLSGLTPIIPFQNLSIPHAMSASCKFPPPQGRPCAPLARKPTPPSRKLRLTRRFSQPRPTGPRVSGVGHCCCEAERGGAPGFECVQGLGEVILGWEVRT